MMFVINFSEKCSRRANAFTIKRPVKAASTKQNKTKHVETASG